MIKESQVYNWVACTTNTDSYCEALGMYKEAFAPQLSTRERLSSMQSEEEMEKEALIAGLTGLAGRAASKAGLKATGSRLSASAAKQYERRAQKQMFRGFMPVSSKGVAKTQLKASKASARAARSAEQAGMQNVAGAQRKHMERQLASRTQQLGGSSLQAEAAAVRSQRQAMQNATTVQQHTAAQRGLSQAEKTLQGKVTQINQPGQVRAMSTVKPPPTANPTNVVKPTPTSTQTSTTVVKNPPASTTPPKTSVTGNPNPTTTPNPTTGGGGAVEKVVETGTKEVAKKPGFWTPKNVGYGALGTAAIGAGGYGGYKALTSNPNAPVQNPYQFGKHASRLYPRR